MYMTKERFNNIVDIYGKACDYALFKFKINGVEAITAVKGKKAVSVYLKYLNKNFNDKMAHKSEDIYLVEFALPTKKGMSIEFLQQFFDIEFKDNYSFKEI